MDAIWVVVADLTVNAANLYRLIFLIDYAGRNLKCSIMIQQSVRKQELVVDSHNQFLHCASSFQLV